VRIANDTAQTGHRYPIALLSTFEKTICAPLMMTLFLG
jgi:hypothetical protein